MRKISKKMIRTKGYNMVYYWCNRWKYTISPKSKLKNIIGIQKKEEDDEKNKNEIVSRVVDLMRWFSLFRGKRCAQYARRRKWHNRTSGSGYLHGKYAYGSCVFVGYID
jgi:hypothetical protein